MASPNLHSGPPSAARPPGPVVYPSEDDVAETTLHLNIRVLLRALAQQWLAAQGKESLVLSDQFVYWVEGDETRFLAPDLLVIPGASPDREVVSWKTWEEAHEPRFAVEIVSEDIDKDYVKAPPKYDDLGVEELIIYDPLVPKKGRTRRVRWQVYRRTDGAWTKVLQTDADRVESVVLGCWLVEVEVNGSRRVRLATGAVGEHLVPTEAEAERARNRDLEAEIERLRAALSGAGRRGE